MYYWRQVHHNHLPSGYQKQMVCPNNRRQQFTDKAACYTPIVILESANCPQVLPESQDDVTFRDGNESQIGAIQEPSGFSLDFFLNCLSDYGSGSLWSSDSEVPSALPSADVQDVRRIPLLAFIFAVTFAY